MKTCPEHRHEHRQLPCPWVGCPNSEEAGDTFEVPRHSGPGMMTQAEGHFDTPPPVRKFERKQWVCESCGASGWGWIEDGAERRPDRCPHRRPVTVTPRPRSRFQGPGTGTRD